MKLQNWDIINDNTGDALMLLQRCDVMHVLVTAKG